MEQSIAADWTGQDVYVGIDLHKRQWSVCILTNERERRPFAQVPRPEVLAQHLKRNYAGGRYHLGYEAGFSGNWIARRFAELGIECVVLHAADIPSSDKDRRRKTDKRDSRKIAHCLANQNNPHVPRNDKVKPLYVPSQADEDLRQMVRSRTGLVRKVTRTKNQIISLLDFGGISVPSHHEMSHWSARFIAWLEGCLQERPLLKQALQIYLDELIWQRQHRRQMLREFHELSRSEPLAEDIALLRTIPGIGLISALVLRTELMDIRRFTTFDDVAAYAGLVPDVECSGQSEHVLGITRRRNTQIRRILIECAWIARRHDPVLQASFDRLIMRMKPSEAIVRIARRLLSRIYSVLIQKEPYRMGIERPRHQQSLSVTPAA